MRQRRRSRLSHDGEDDDPMSVVSNLFDVAMEIITKDGQKINRYTPSEDQSNKSGNKGKKVGIAYQLENGEIIYVPEDK